MFTKKKPNRSIHKHDYYESVFFLRLHRLLVYYVYKIVNLI